MLLKNMLPCEYLGERRRPQNVVILLHGLGANANDLISFAELLPFAQGGKTLFVFPQAPLLPVTVHDGTILPAWYDIYSFEKNSTEDRRGLQLTHNAIRAIIVELLKANIPSERIVLGGFSQGGAAALYYASHCHETIAGVAGLSAYLPLPGDLQQTTSPRVPIFMSHGIYDEIILPEYARLSRDRLRKANYKVFFQTYPLGHSLDKDVAIDFSDWCAEQLDNETLNRQNFTF